MRKRQEYAYAEVKEAFRRIWVVPTLPTDARLFICGAVQQAAVRQGDEAFPVEIFQKIIERKPLEYDEMVAMVEGVHELILIRDGLRPQYLTIVVRMITSYFDRAFYQASNELTAAAASN